MSGIKYVCQSSVLPECNILIPKPQNVVDEPREVCKSIVFPSISMTCEGTRHSFTPLKTQGLLSLPSCSYSTHPSLPSFNYLYHTPTHYRQSFPHFNNYRENLSPLQPTPMVAREVYGSRRTTLAVLLNCISPADRALAISTMRSVV